MFVSPLFIDGRTGSETSLEEVTNAPANNSTRKWFCPVVHPIWLAPAKGRCIGSCEVATRQLVFVVGQSASFLIPPPKNNNRSTYQDASQQNGKGTAQLATIEILLYRVGP
jgi:hypothetical protein